jgi:sterol desaturase/sphingolipid hydroxylase (fatty acid hydroxylase superfamily)
MVGPDEPRARAVPFVSEYDGAFRRALSVGIFPITMIAFFGGGMLALRHGLPPELLNPIFVPPFMGWIIAWERIHPYVRAWNLDHDDTRQDLTHAIVSNLVTPQLVNAMLGIALIPLGAALSARIHWFSWPAHWPFLLQIIFALVVAEFGGYWAHRAQHAFPMLWRVHALHHSAARLYWLNAGRFHPFDSGMLTAAGFAPLILLGCPKDTMAMCLLFAGMHGTFQHANIHVKLGFLNWIFSMSELHRWHHSRRIDESNSNYSGHVLIWDIVFGTRFLPKDRLPPCDIGIEGMPTFPTDYLTQLKSPFILERLKAAADSHEADGAPMVVNTR